MIGDRVEPTSEKAKSYVTKIKILAVLQSIIAIMDIIAHNSFLREGIFGLFFILVLFHAYHQLSYKAIVIYTFMSLFFSVIFLVYILKILQNGADPSDVETGWDRYYIAVASISFVFYVFNSIFYFFPYREFKSAELPSNNPFTQVNMNSDVERNQGEMKEPPRMVTIDYYNNQQQIEQPQWQPKKESKTEEKAQPHFDIFKTDISQVGKKTSGVSKRGSFEPFSGTGVAIG